MGADLAAEARRESARLGLALKQYIRECDSTAAYVSRKLERAPQYLTRVFAGILPLRIEEVFGLFEILGKHPQIFFDRHYPLAGDDRSGRISPPDPSSPGSPNLRAYLDSTMAAPLPPPSEMVKRAGRILKGLIVRAGTRQRAVSLKLGLPRDALGQALRGGTDLAAWHVFGVLAATNTSAGRFFHELLGPDDSLASAAPGAARWEDLVEALERALTGYMEHQALKPATAQAEPEGRRTRQPARRTSKPAKPKR